MPDLCAIAITSNDRLEDVQHLVRALQSRGYRTVSDLPRVLPLWVRNGASHLILTREKGLPGACTLWVIGGPRIHDAPQRLSVEAALDLLAYNQG